MPTLRGIRKTLEEMKAASIDLFTQLDDKIKNLEMSLDKVEERIGKLEGKLHQHIAKDVS